MAAQPAIEREDPFPFGPRRQRDSFRRSSQSGGRRGQVQTGRPSLSGNGPHRPWRGPGRQPGPRRPQARRLGFRDRSGSTDYPITPKEHGVDYLLDRRHLWIRSEQQPAILRIRHEVSRPSATSSTIGASSSPTRRFLRRPRARGRPRCSRWTISRIRRSTSPRADSSTQRPTRWRSAASTTSGRCSAPRNRRRVAISPSSGWWSRRWRTRRWTT